ncbi:MAG: hypothetical protein L3J67_04610 [Hyphomicrobiaceae bacterium]|nr:hypothetical protein [Hyphomicrobiaceae bacterium]
MNKLRKITLALLGIAVLFMSGTIVSAAPFGSKSDVATAGKIWNRLAAVLMVGPDRINVRPFEGTEPHGAIQQVMASKIMINGRKRRVIVKANHLGEGISVATVYDNPNKFLKAYTIMFKMKKGYDPANKDWFWMKFDPKGALLKHPKGMPLAGKIAKGSEKGCIFCHKASGGEDLETLSEK